MHSYRAHQHQLLWNADVEQGLKVWPHLTLFTRLKYNQGDMKIKWIIQKHIRIEPLAFEI